MYEFINDIVSLSIRVPFAQRFIALTTSFNDTSWQGGLFPGFAHCHMVDVVVVLVGVDVVVSSVVVVSGSVVIAVVVVVVVVVVIVVTTANVPYDRPARLPPVSFAKQFNE